MGVELFKELILMFGCEADYVIELAKEVRKVLGTAKGIPKERKLVAALHVAIKDNIPSLQVRPRQEAVAMD